MVVRSTDQETHYWGTQEESEAYTVDVSDIFLNYSY